MRTSILIFFLSFLPMGAIVYFYTGSPSCMLSRGARLTGQHPLRNGLNNLKNNPGETIDLSSTQQLISEWQNREQTVRQK